MAQGGERSNARAPANHGGIMNLGIGLAITRAGQVVAWSPENLRVGTRVVQDLTFDPSRLFSDVEGTTLIAGPGAEVAAQKDGRGVIVREQPVFAARPKYALEPASGVRNRLRNNRGDGAVVGVLGSGGALPTGMTVSGIAEGSVEVLSIAAKNGRPNTKIRINGTPTANVQISFVNTTVVPAVAGQTWTTSVWAQMTAGSMANFTAALTEITTHTTSGVFVNSGGTGFQSTIGDDLRRSTTLQLSGGTIAFVRSLIQLTWSSGAVDITLDISAPQLEQASAATDVQIVGANGFDVTEPGVRSVHALAYDRGDDWMQLSTAFQPAGNYTLAMGHAHRGGEISWLFGHSSISGLQALRGGAANAFLMRSDGTGNQSSFTGSEFTAAATGRAVAIARVAGTGLADGYMNGFGPLAGTLTGAMTPPNAAGINAVGRSVNSFDAPRREYGGVLIDPGNTPVTNEEITLMLRHLAYNEGITL